MKLLLFSKLSDKLGWTGVGSVEADTCAFQGGEHRDPGFWGSRGLLCSSNSEEARAQWVRGRLLGTEVGGMGSGLWNKKCISFRTLEAMVGKLDFSLRNMENYLFSFTTILFVWGRKKSDKESLFDQILVRSSKFSCQLGLDFELLCLRITQF